jgi:Caspase domain
MKKLSCLPRQLLITALCATGLLTFSATAQAPNDVRIALIIGNSAYPGNMALANPSNDAKDMAATLRSMGFGVIEVRDASREQMTAAIERANKALNGKQGVGMLFYAGHGLQLDWRNYMVPVDAKLNSAKDVPANTVDIEVVMNAFKSAGNRMSIVVLDACRDNPFADGKTASGKGLAPLDAPTGTFLAYATAPGNVAADGSGKNGLYTGFLLRELQRPSARIEDVFKRVRFAVRQASNGAQIPWEATSLEDDFVFNSGIKTAVKLSEAEKENLFDSENTDWDKIKDSTNADDVYAFLQKYPSGLFSQGAMGVLNRLNRAKVTAYTDRSGIRHDTNQMVYRVGDSVEISRKDGDTGQEIRTRSPRIESIENGIVRIADGSILTTRGEVIRGQGNSYNPPRPMRPADGLVVGKKWISRSIFTPVRQMTSELGNDIQTMLVQANNFKRNEILRPPIGEKSPNLMPRPEAPNRMPSRVSTGNWIEEQGQVLALETITIPAGIFKAFKIEVTSSSPNGTDVKSTYWMLPDFGFPIKQQLEMRRSNGKSTRWTEEAINITRGS